MGRPKLPRHSGPPLLQGIQGRSLSPLPRGETTAHRDSVYMEFYDSSRLFDPPPMATSVRTGLRKLTVYHSLNGGELYDLEKDPGEFRNLRNDPNARGPREEMLFKLVSRMAETADPLPAGKSTF